MYEHQAAARRTGPVPANRQALLELVRLRTRARIGDEKNVIGLTYRALAPGGRPRVGLIEHEAMGELLLVQPVHERQRVRAPLLRGCNAVVFERLVDLLRVEETRRAVKPERVREAARERGDVDASARGCNGDRVHRPAGGHTLTTEPLHQLARNSSQHARVALDEVIEGRGRNLRK